MLLGNLWIILAFVLTVLSPTDLFPKYIRDEFIWPYSLKVVPCILIWTILSWQLISGKLAIKESRISG